MHELRRWHRSLILHKALLGRSCYSVLLQLILKHTMRRFRFSSRRLAGSHQRSNSDNVDIGTSLPGYIYLTDTVIIKKIHVLLIDVGPKDLHLKIGANEVNDCSLNSCLDHASLPPFLNHKTFLI